MRSSQNTFFTLETKRINMKETGFCVTFLKHTPKSQFLNPFVLDLMKKWKSSTMEVEVQGSSWGSSVVGNRCSQITETGTGKSPLCTRGFRQSSWWNSYSGAEVLKVTPPLPDNSQISASKRCSVFHNPWLLLRVLSQSFCNMVGHFHCCDRPSTCRDTAGGTVLLLRKKP